MAKLETNLYRKLIDRFEAPFSESISRLSTEEAEKLIAIISDPTLTIGVDKSQIPTGASITTSYGKINLGHDLKSINKVWINGTPFRTIKNDLDAIKTLASNNTTVEEIREVIEKDPFGRNASTNRTSDINKTGARRTNYTLTEEEFQELQDQAYDDLLESEITYKNFFNSVGHYIAGKDYTAADIMTELASRDIAEEEIPEFLAYKSDFHREIVGNLYGRDLGRNERHYDFKKVEANDETFVGRLLTKIGVEEAEYDEKRGTVQFGNGRKITNLPKVDENGVFSNRFGKKYIPYHIGYFDPSVEGSRVDKFRHVDPVDRAFEAVALQKELTTGDIRFKAILDVSRNLPDFENHPYGKEILEAYKNKIVINKGYADTNSLSREFEGQADELGAVNTMMLDEDAKGLLDPYGTSNGANLGYIMYLAKDAKFNKDGTFTKGEAIHSELGDVMNKFMVDKDNFNRNQMSYNALLTSIDVKKINVVYSEFALFNSEDAVVITKNGAEKMSSYHDVEVLDENGEVELDRFKRPVTHEVMQPMKVGDKVMDMHGNKSISSLVLDPDMDKETAEKEQLTHAVEFARLNPDVDMIVSPVSLASRLNLGVAHEALQGEKKDLHLPDGSVVKNGIVEMSYLVLPQTAEHKSKDYGIDKGGRKYSSLFRYSLSSKVGEELYEKAFLTEEQLNANRDKVVSTFERLGVSFKDEDKLAVKGNVNGYVDSDVTIDYEEFSMQPAMAIRSRIQYEVRGELRGGKLDKNVTRTVNIDLGDNELISPITGKPIVDSQGRNVLPIRCINGAQAFRYNEMYQKLGSLGEESGLEQLQEEYNHCVSADYEALTRKDNLLKNLKTVTFYEGAKTEMITPDPRIRLNEIRTSIDCDRVVAHRDPAFHSGNSISFVNVGGNEPNLTHINPLMVNQIDGDFDSDTMGINSFDNLNLTDKEKDIFYNRSSVTEQLNKHGKVFLATDSSHFKANALVNNLDTSDITFEDGKSNEELQEVVEGITKKIIDSPISYGAYALDFTDEHTVKESLGRLADDGIKGNRKDIENHFDNGYMYEENLNVMKALIAKNEWTGKAGSVMNKFVASVADTKFDDELIRVGSFVFSSTTQSVLQMKKNADKLPEIDDKIKTIKEVMSGEDTNGNAIDKVTARGMLLRATEDVLDPKITNRFCDIVDAKTGNFPRFGQGVINNIETGTSQLAYMNSKEKFNNAMLELIEESKEENKVDMSAKISRENDIVAAARARRAERLEKGIVNPTSFDEKVAAVEGENSKMAKALALRAARLAAMRAEKEAQAEKPKELSEEESMEKFKEAVEAKNKEMEAQAKLDEAKDASREDTTEEEIQAMIDKFKEKTAVSHDQGMQL